MNDEELAGLLGDAPQTPDPRFRADVLARVAGAARRRAAANRAARTLAVFAAIGLFFPLTQAAGFSLEHVQPLFLSVAVVGLTYLFAIAAVKGPRTALAQSLSALGIR